MEVIICYQKIKGKYKLTHLPPFSSKLITTGAQQTLCFQSYYPVGTDVSFINSLENLETFTLFKVFRG